MKTIKTLSAAKPFLTATVAVHGLRAILTGGCAILVLGAATTNLNAGMIVGIADSNIGSAVNDQFFTNLFSGDDVYGRGSGSDWTLTNWSTRIAANGGNFTSGTLSAGALTGKEWAVLSTNSAYSASELSLLSGFIGSGGSIVVIGEGPFYSYINNNANQVLSTLGSSMTFSLSAQASSPWTISADPLMAGVTNFDGNYVGGIIGGTSLITGANGYVAAAYTNTASSVPDGGTTIAMLGLALTAVVGARRKFGI